MECKLTCNITDVYLSCVCGWFHQEIIMNNYLISNTGGKKQNVKTDLGTKNRFF